MLYISLDVAVHGDSGPKKKQAESEWDGTLLCPVSRRSTNPKKKRCGDAVEGKVDAIEDVSHGRDGELGSFAPGIKETH